MNSEGDVLLKSIREDPDNDTPRLVYADWLEERGDEASNARAEFIRLSIEIHRYVYGGNFRYDDPHYRSICERADHLASQHGRHWTEGLPYPVGVDWHCRAWRHGGYTRGFVGYVEFSSAKAFVDHAAAVFSATAVEYVRFKRITSKTAKRVFASENSYLLDRLRELDLSKLRQGSVGELNKPSNELGPTGTAVIATCAHLHRLEKLDLEQNELGDDGVVALCNALSLGRLKTLELGMNKLTETSGEALGSTSQFPWLQHLNLSWNRIGSTGFAALMKSTRRRELISVIAQGNQIGDEGIIGAFDGEVGPSQLKSLWLQKNGLTDSAAAAIAGCTGLNHLESIELEGNGLTTAGVRLLLTSPNLPMLTRIRVAENHVAPLEARALRAEFPGRMVSAGREVSN